MDLEQIQVIKGRSRGAAKSDSPWNSKYVDDQYAMWAKTCLKRVAKWCTKSAELVTAIEYDNVVDGDIGIERKVSVDSSLLLDTPVAAELPSSSVAASVSEDVVFSFSDDVKSK